MPNRARLVLAAGLLLGASASVAYRGDGHFLDRGPLTAHERYVIDFGAVDLAVAAPRTFLLGDLPDAAFTLGLRVSSNSLPEVPTWKQHPFNPTVRLVLTDESGQVLLDTRDPLEKWTWSGRVDVPSQAFVYRRDFDFTPKRNASYRLLLEAVHPDVGLGAYSVRLQMVGGGWK
jgi:hypothetical protein